MKRGERSRYRDDDASDRVPEFEFESVVYGELLAASSAVVDGWLCSLLLSPLPPLSGCGVPGLPPLGLALVLVVVAMPVPMPGILTVLAVWDVVLAVVVLAVVVLVAVVAGAAVVAAAPLLLMIWLLLALLLLLLLLLLLFRRKCSFTRCSARFIVWIRTLKRRMSLSLPLLPLLALALALLLLLFLLLLLLLLLRELFCRRGFVCVGLGRRRGVCACGATGCTCPCGPAGQTRGWVGRCVYACVVCMNERVCECMRASV
ncbi:uncharacterized protein K452DRAFT_141644 [Aplosporella prunicola CBS 121167]|uniref:Uncharacterized protein n=1 Tax=Aplosporella prunicola CBS 121167 TaxID=1176127 RepID=A0A6A6BJV0_9PEZI|nr:uncharacterized protein K452DRAFT_141644 [Aplosporella prunicola CBS 121167]KAF2144420.1 hypothetical protein K452DRAFT_141644 [Aplosporella prunicola CBS 121167]